jgi:aminomethyltransferase
MPWSRPGDYVLFQAQKDLVCVSSACPSDTEPSNDWNPTDIYVRVYNEKNRFSKSIGYRKNADSDFMLTKETGFHPRTSKLTKDMMDSSGFWIPNKYNNYGTIAEYEACRNNVIVMDLSSLRKFEILGPDAEELINTALTRNIKKLAVGQVVYSALCYENGTMIDDGTLYRLGEHNFRWICGSDYSGEWLRELAKKLQLKVKIKTSTDHLHNISVQGPNSRNLLSKIIWTPPAHPDVNDLKWFHFSISRIHDHIGTPIMLSRTGYTGELGYEIYCHPKDAVKVWDAVWEAGKEYNLTPMGFEALDMLRIEAGLILGGNEFSDETDPFEAGIAFTVPLKTKEQNFIGREALIERKAHPQRKLVGLEIEGNEKAIHGDCVHSGRAQVGIITSGTFSPTLNKNIALCRVDIHSSELGTKLEIGKLGGHQKRISATVVKFPFYDPDKSRVKA